MTFLGLSLLAHAKACARPSDYVLDTFIVAHNTTSRTTPQKQTKYDATCLFRVFRGRMSSEVSRFASTLTESA